MKRPSLAFKSVVTRILDFMIWAFSFGFIDHMGDLRLKVFLTFMPIFVPCFLIAFPLGIIAGAIAAGISALFHRFHPHECNLVKRENDPLNMEYYDYQGKLVQDKMFSQARKAIILHEDALYLADSSKVKTIKLYRTKNNAADYDSLILKITETEKLADKDELKLIASIIAHGLKLEKPPTQQIPLVPIDHLISRQVVLEKQNKFVEKLDLLINFFSVKCRELEPQYQRYQRCRSDIARLNAELESLAAKKLDAEYRVKYQRDVASGHITEIENACTDIKKQIEDMQREKARTKWAVKEFLAFQKEEEKALRNNPNRSYWSKSPSSHLLSNTQYQLGQLKARVLASQKNDELNRLLTEYKKLLKSFEVRFAGDELFQLNDYLPKSKYAQCFVLGKTLKKAEAQKSFALPIELQREITYMLAANNEYNLRLLTPEQTIEERTLYLSNINNKIAYSLITPSGNRVDNQVTEINAPADFSLNELNKLKRQILEFAANQSHTPTNISQKEMEEIIAAPSLS